ncbi:ribonuclease P protein component [bacterium]|nr:ribonuclease P protein component [bacterium]
MLARASRLRRNRDIVRVLKRGRILRTSHLKLYALSSSLQNSRATVVISKKVDKRATVRNRNRRRVIEIVRELLPQLQGHFDILIYINADLKDVGSADLRREVGEGLKKQGVLL